jgi:hypothetical protein
MVIALTNSLVSRSPSCATLPKARGAGRKLTAMHMATQVLPDVPVRHWVLRVPHKVRRLLGGEGCGAFFGADDLFERGDGMVRFPQRFGGSLHLHVHNSVVYLDGVFSKDADGKASFQASGAPAQTEVAGIAAEVGRHLKKMLKRRGLIRGEPDDAEPESQSAIEACMQLGLSRGVFVRLDARDQGRPQGNDDARFDHRKRSPRSADADGFSVHAGVRMRQGDAAGRARLVRYCARPTLSIEQLSVLCDGRIARSTRGVAAERICWCRRCNALRPPTAVLVDLAVLRFARTVRFMAHNSALIPPPRFPLVSYSGVLAPASKWRSSAVPRGKTIG